MNTKLLFAAVISSVFLFSSRGQSQEYFVPKKTEPKSAFKTTWQKKELKDAWYISFGSGVQLLSSDNDGQADLKDRLTYAPSLTVGRYFSPIWGLRANFTGGSAHGFEDDAKIMQHVHYWAVNTSFTFDLFTLFGYYNPKAPFELVPFVGPSFYYAPSNDNIESSNGLGLNAGIQAKIRLSDSFNFFLESNTMIFPGKFDGDLTKKNDKVQQFTAGLTYKIGDHEWKACEPMDFDFLRRMNNQVNDLKNKLEDLAKRECPECPECPAEARPKGPNINIASPKKEVPKVQPVKKMEPIWLPDPVFFAINKSIIRDSEIERIEIAVKYLNDNPNADVEVTGYADKKTGTAKRNLQLSKERSLAVAKMLEEKYGIDKSRITTNFKGDGIQPFIQNNDWNRVVMFRIIPK